MYDIIMLLDYNQLVRFAEVMYMAKHEFGIIVYLTMLYGHVHQTIEYEYIAKLRREIKSNAAGHGTPNGNFINVGCMMPYMDYTPRTLDEIIEGDARYHEENPDAL